MKRPLAMGSILFVLLLFFVQMLLQPPPFFLSQIEKNGGCIIGTVQKIEYKNNQSLIYLSNVSFLNHLDQSDQINFNIQTYQKQNSQVGCLCYLDMTAIGPEYLKKDQVIPKIGSIVVCEGKPVDFDEVGNPGMFDVKAYYASEGIYFTLFDTKILGISSQYHIVSEKLFEFREFIAGILEKEFKAYAGILKIMLLGDKSTLDSDIKAGYQYAGISHILAISGLHVSIIGMGLFGILRRIRIPIVASTIASILLLCLYTNMTGGSISTMRAGMMFSLYLWSKVLKKPYDFATAFFFSAAITLSLKNGVGGAGFFLSYAAVFGMTYVSGPIYHWFPEVLRRKLGTLTKGLSSGIGILITSLPIQLFYFYGNSPFALLVNLVVVPLLMILLPCLFVVILLHICLPGLVVVFRLPVNLILYGYEWIVSCVENIPAYYVVSGRPSWWQITVYYVLLIVWYFSNKYLKKFFQFLFLMLMCVFLVVRPHPNMTIEVLDVGQGDGIYIETGTGYSLFIDGGSGTEKELGKYVLIPFLKEKGRMTIDYLFISHYDADHINGWVEIFSMWKEHPNRGDIPHVASLVLAKGTQELEEGKELLELAKYLGVRIYLMEKGDTMDFHGVHMDCIHPKFDNSHTENENSMVLLLNYKEFSMLFTGDLEGNGEAEVIEVLKELNQTKSIEVLKVGHHGSAYGSTFEFLQVLNAKEAVISYGKDNRYGHPAKEVIERLKKEEMHIYETGRNGSIRIETNGSWYRICSFR